MQIGRNGRKFRNEDESKTKTSNIKNQLYTERNTEREKKRARRKENIVLLLEFTDTLQNKLNLQNFLYWKEERRSNLSDALFDLELSVRAGFI